MSHDLHKAVSYVSLTKEEFYQLRKDEKILNGKSPRDLVCALSDMMQVFYGQQIWGQVLYDDIKTQADKHLVDNPSYTVVIDDWRRLIESKFLEDQGDFNIVKVYLEKEDLKNKPSKGSSHYEGQIKPEDCDIVFKYDKKYSNFEELIGLIQNAIK